MLTRAAVTLYLVSAKKNTHTHWDYYRPFNSTVFKLSQFNSNLSNCNYVHHILQVNKQSNFYIGSSHVYSKRSLSTSVTKILSLIKNESTNDREKATTTKTKTTKKEEKQTRKNRNNNQTADYHHSILQSDITPWETQVAGTINLACTMHSLINYLSKVMPSVGFLHSESVIVTLMTVFFTIASYFPSYRS